MPNLIINLTPIGQTLALIGIAFLLMLWVCYSRRLFGFLLTAMGIALLVEAALCNGNMAWLGRAAVVTLMIGLLLLVLYGLHRARRRRVPVYVPKKAREA